MYNVVLGTLNANSDDLFCGICRDGTGLWTQVADDKGAVGYLPTNYLELCNWVRQTDCFVKNAYKQGVLLICLEI